jgi:IS30 family transposase
MPPKRWARVSGRYLSFAEREEIAILHAQKVGFNEIGRRIGRAGSTVSRELRRNAATAQQRIGVSGINGAVARRAARQPAEGLEVGGQRSSSGLRSGPAGRSHRPTGW